jgi:Flp pilus assembly protein TadD
MAASFTGIAIWMTATRRPLYRLNSGSAYQNTAVGVKYVGDKACVRCHAEIVAHFSHTPMGSSLSPVALASGNGGAGAGQNGQFEAQGLRYSVENRAGHTIHIESRHDASGRMVARNEAEVQYVLGSGRQAFAFLIERDGFLFESPITWYAAERKWQLSPSYERRNYHFQRPILEDCLFCHTNRVERASSALNRYRSPIFHGCAIGCERCHGPGEIHIRRSQVVDGRDVSIVNPAKLEPAIADAVCEQCHLIGLRVSRPDLGSDDYRPGLPFYRFWSAFVPAAESGDNRFASQAEQMHESRCYSASRGRLRCVSCHDPHALPQPEEKAAYYRDRCLECHADRGCSLPGKLRLERKRGDDCTACHMPQSHSSNNIHVATTNHRIPRHANDRLGHAPSGATPSRAGRTLVNFHRHLMNDQERMAAERDRGIALWREGRAGAAAALPLLEAALTLRPDDLPALEAKGEALGLLGRQEAGLVAYRESLSKDPFRETALGGAGKLASQSRRYVEAVSLWQRAIAINPWRSDYHAELALAQLQLGDWRSAADSCREVLRLNPAFVDVRKWLIRCYLHLGDTASAHRELEVVLGFDPPDRDELLRLFGEPTRRP